MRFRCEAACRPQTYNTKTIDCKLTYHLKPNLLKCIRNGRSKVSRYKYGMVKRRRKLLKDGYRFDEEKKDWVKVLGRKK